MYSSRTTATDFDPHDNHKFIDDAELQVAVRRVRQAKQKKQAEDKWNEFLQSKYENSRHPNNITTNQCYTPSPRENKSCLTTNKLTCEDATLLQHKGYLAGIDETIKGSRVISKIDMENTSNEVLSHTYQLGPGLGKRLQDLLSTVTKMSAVLLSPELQELGEEEDVDRTIKRSVEFDAMFARNHLYEIQRLLKESKQFTMAKFANTIEFEGKISAALKCVTQALQVYTKHVSKGSRAKFQQLVPIFQSISLINNLLEKLTGQHTFPLRQDIEVSCSYLKQILLEINTTETRTVSTSSRKPVRMRHKHKPSSDLSMYSRRQKNEWRKKSAFLARAKFGAPLSKTHDKQFEPLSAKDTQSDIEVSNVPATDGLSSFTLTNKNVNKSQLHVKAVNDPNSKEVSFRNATRAVPEEHVKTMMEAIPNEPLEESQLCLDDRTFQALKFLNESCTKQNNVAKFQDDGDQRLQPPESKEQDISKSISVNRENVKLICLKEDDKITENLASFDDEISKSHENNETVLSLDQTNGADLHEYNEKVSQFNTQLPQHKDTKALTTIDRLANHILMDMVIDYRKEEMDKIVNMLYSLEFK